MHLQVSKAVGHAIELTCIWKFYGHMLAHKHL